MVEGQKYIPSFTNPHHAFIEADEEPSILNLHEDTKVLALDSLNYVTSEFVVLPKGIQYFNKDRLIYRVSLLKGFLYKGSVEDAKDVEVGYNGAIKEVNLADFNTVCDGYNHQNYDVYFYSETKPVDTAHKYWKYDIDGVTPIIW